MNLLGSKTRATQISGRVSELEEEEEEELDEEAKRAVKGT